jgi:hypothetical protein
MGNFAPKPPSKTTQKPLPGRVRPTWGDPNQGLKPNDRAMPFLPYWQDPNDPQYALGQEYKRLGLNDGQISEKISNIQKAEEAIAQTREDFANYNQEAIDRRKQEIQDARIRKELQISRDALAKREETIAYLEAQNPGEDARRMQEIRDAQLRERLKISYDALEAREKTRKYLESTIQPPKKEPLPPGFNQPPNRIPRPASNQSTQSRPSNPVQQIPAPRSRPTLSGAGSTGAVAGIEAQIDAGRRSSNQRIIEATAERYGLTPQQYSDLTPAERSELIRANNHPFWEAQTEDAKKRSGLSAQEWNNTSQQEKEYWRRQSNKDRWQDNPINPYGNQWEGAPWNQKSSQASLGGIGAAADIGSDLAPRAAENTLRLPPDPSHNPGSAESRIPPLESWQIDPLTGKPLDLSRPANGYYTIDPFGNLAWNPNSDETPTILGDFSSFNPPDGDSSAQSDPMGTWNVSIDSAGHPRWFGAFQARQSEGPNFKPRPYGEPNRTIWDLAMGDRIVHAAWTTWAEYTRPLIVGASFAPSAQPDPEPDTPPQPQPPALPAPTNPVTSSPTGSPNERSAGSPLPGQSQSQSRPPSPARKGSATNPMPKPSQVPKDSPLATPSRFPGFSSAPSPSPSSNIQISPQQNDRN